MTIPDGWCWWHSTIKEDSANAFLRCGECFHSFMTEQELLDEHNRAMGDIGVPPITDSSKILSCPLCIHDF